MNTLNNSNTFTGFLNFTFRHKNWTTTTTTECKLPLTSQSHLGEPSSPPKLPHSLGGMGLREGFEFLPHLPGDLELADPRRLVVLHGVVPGVAAAPGMGSC